MKSISIRAVSSVIAVTAIIECKTKESEKIADRFQHDLRLLGDADMQIDTHETFFNEAETSHSASHFRSMPDVA